jgi:hypothetical protein
MKPTLLPCKHTFCFKCIQNNQQIRPGSLPCHSNNGFLSNDNQTKIITCQKCFSIHHIKSLTDLVQNQSIELLINTLLCETCQQLHPSNQLDTCLHCFGVLCSNCYDSHLKNHQNETKKHTKLDRIVSVDETIHSNKQSTDSQILKSKSFNLENKPTIEPTKPLIKIENTENLDPSQINPPKKKSNNLFRKIINPSRHRQSHHTTEKDSVAKTPSSSIKKTSSAQISRPSKLNLGQKIEEISKIETNPTTIPFTPVRRFLNLNHDYTHTAEHIKRCKQRQSELDRSVNKLIEVFTLKTNENLNQISNYWIYLKDFILNQYQTKTNRFQLFDYLLKTCCSTLDSQKQMEFYIKQNDEITAELQILSTTLTIVNTQQTLLTISQLFDREEQTTIRALQRHLESSLSAYADELSFIIERIHVYEARFAAWKNCNTMDLDSITYEWTQSIEHDYPALIEKISNDFLTKVPQIETILVQMLQNMRRGLLNTNTPIPTRRTNDC